MTITKVILTGANGKLGSSIVKQFQAAQTYVISVIVRASSKATYPDDIKQVRVSDSMPHDELVAALKGQDALVLAFNGMQTATSIKLADAALEAGVKRVIPADYGSCDSSDPHSLELLPLYKEKQKVRDHLVQLSAKSDGALSWTTLITGHFLDDGLESGLLQVDLRKKTARIFDGGDIKWSATTLDSIAYAVVKTLQKDEATKNKIIYVQSISATQNELLKIVEEVMDTKFAVEHIDSAEFIKKYQARLAQNPDDAGAIEELVSVEGTVNADWEKREGFSNQLLGMPSENLKDIVKKVVGKLRTGGE
jgi:uncharacterized protein YbjT (DUF2867 family)